MILYIIKLDKQKKRQPLPQRQKGFLEERLTNQNEKSQREKDQILDSIYQIKWKMQPFDPFGLNLFFLKLKTKY